MELVTIKEFSDGIELNYVHEKIIELHVKKYGGGALLEALAKITTAVYQGMISDPDTRFRMAWERTIHVNRSDFGFKLGGPGDPGEPGPCSTCHENCDRKICYNFYKDLLDQRRITFINYKKEK